MNITRRHLPHWDIPGSVYHVTFRFHEGQLDEEEIAIVLGQIKRGNEKYYTLYAGQVMPDHVHLMLQPMDGMSLSRIMKGIKEVSARLINAKRNRLGQCWQGESFDRIIRSQSDFDEKLLYMFNNPVRAGIVSSPEEYCGWYCWAS